MGTKVEPQNLLFEKSMFTRHHYNMQYTTANYIYLKALHYYIVHRLVSKLYSLSIVDLNYKLYSCRRHVAYLIVRYH